MLKYITVIIFVPVFCFAGEVKQDSSPTPTPAAGESVGPKAKSPSDDYMATLKEMALKEKELKEDIAKEDEEARRRIKESEDNETRVEMNQKETKEFQALWTKRLTSQEWVSYWIDPRGIKKNVTRWKLLPDGRLFTEGRDTQGKWVWISPREIEFKDVGGNAIRRVRYQTDMLGDNHNYNGEIKIVPEKKGTNKPKEEEKGKWVMSARTYLATGVSYGCHGAGPFVTALEWDKVIRFQK